MARVARMPLADEALAVLGSALGAHLGRDDRHRRRRGAGDVGQRKRVRPAGAGHPEPSGAQRRAVPGPCAGSGREWGRAPVAASCSPGRRAEHRPTGPTACGSTGRHIITIARALTVFAADASAIESRNRDQRAQADTGAAVVLVTRRHRHAHPSGGPAHHRSHRGGRHPGGPCPPAGVRRVNGFGHRTRSGAPQGMWMSRAVHVRQYGGSASWRQAADSNRFRERQRANRDLIRRRFILTSAVSICISNHRCAVASRIVGHLSIPGGQSE